MCSEELVVKKVIRILREVIEEDIEDEQGEYSIPEEYSMDRAFTLLGDEFQVVVDSMSNKVDRGNNDK